MASKSKCLCFDGSIFSILLKVWLYWIELYKFRWLYYCFWNYLYSWCM